MRTFVFISDIPDFLLQPLQLNDNNAGSMMLQSGGHVKANRDPRYERLRRLLSLHTSGVMLVMHLENKPFALALYASEEEALAACKTTIIPQKSSHTAKLLHSAREVDNVENSNNTNRSNEVKPLKLRIVQKEIPPPIEAVYTPTITIEGSVVNKDDLVLTRGLELVYRGKAIARWCECTRAEKDCPFGWGCHKIHLKRFQKTIRKRLRTRSHATSNSDTTSRHHNNNNNNGTENEQQEEEQQQEEEHLDAEIKEAQDKLLRSYVMYQDKLIPHDSIQLEPRVLVPISFDEAEHLILHCNTSSECDQNVLHNNSLAHRIVERVKMECNKTADFTGPFFIRLSCPGGSPWDWSLYDESNDDDDNNANSEISHINNDNIYSSNEEVVTHEQEEEEEEEEEGQQSSNMQKLIHGVRELRARCPYPAHGTQTLLERDIYAQQLLYNMNQLNKFSTAEQAIHALMCSQRVKENLRDYFHEIRKASNDHNNHAKARRINTRDDNNNGVKELLTSSNNNATHIALNRDNEEQLYLCLLPWLYLPTVGTEVSVFMQENGNKLRGVIQRYDQLRLMLPLSRLLCLENSYDNNDDNNDNDNFSSSNDNNNEIKTRKAIANELHRFVLLTSNDTSDDEVDKAIEIDNEILEEYEEEEEEEKQSNALSALLKREMKTTNTAFMNATEQLRKHIALHSEQIFSHYKSAHKNENSSNANNTEINLLDENKISWCAHLALVLPQHKSVLQDKSAKNEETEEETRESNNRSERKVTQINSNEQCTPLQFIELDKCRVVVLSFTSYYEAANRSSLYNTLGHYHSNNNHGTSHNVYKYVSAKNAAVIWNAHKHQYVPLFDRGVLEKLKQPK